MYSRLEAFPLPRELTPTDVRAFAALSKAVEPDSSGELSLDILASLLFYSAGVTREKTFPGGTVYFRAAACAGALYPIEVYAVCGGISDLQPGVYHFSPGDFSLRALRAGDYRGALAASANFNRIATAPVTLVYSALSWRSTWKYRDRAYRYHYWDNGTVLANTIAMAHAHCLRHELVMGFVDSDVNDLIGVDGAREFALSLLPIGESINGDNSVGVPAVERLQLETVPLSECEVEYPSIEQMHRASALTTLKEVAEWQRSMVPCGPTSGASQPLATRLLEPLSEAELPRDAIEHVIERRASTRRFARKPISFAELSTIVERSIVPVAGARFCSISAVYFIANDVDGLEPGAYCFNPNLEQAEPAFELLKKGSFRKEAAYLTLEQDLGGDASVTFFLMSNVSQTLNVLGNRGYRVAQMEAGIIGGKMYLAAYALGRGATGLTFYDDDVSAFFSPRAAEESCMLAVSVGVPGKRPAY